MYCTKMSKNVYMLVETFLQPNCPLFAFWKDVIAHFRGKTGSHYFAYRNVLEQFQHVSQPVPAVCFFISIF